MRTLKLIVAVVVFLFATNIVLAQDKPMKLKKNEALVVYSVNIDCHSCEQKIKKNLPFDVKGVKDLRTSIEKQQVTIKYETKRTDTDKLQKAIEKLGFKCQEVK